jgi:hypothetical protein
VKKKSVENLTTLREIGMQIKIQAAYNDKATPLGGMRPVLMNTVPIAGSSEMKLPSVPIIVALDFSSLSCALKKAEQLDPALCKVKVGKELYTKVGPDSVISLRKLGFDVFLDLKFHDIPNTVARACEAAADLGVLDGQSARLWWESYDGNCG